MRRRKSVLSYEVMHDPWLRGHKVAFAFFALACIAMAATGLATLPRPAVVVTDLASRLEGASAFASSLLAASDGLLDSAAALRPIMSDAAEVLQGEAALQTLGADVQCASALLDTCLANPTALRAQLLDATSALKDGVAPALAAAAALLNATSGATGATPALAAVAAMPTLLTDINSTLTSYGNTLTALPASRQPTSASGQAVLNLQAAQTAMDLPRWLTSLDALYTSVLTVAAAAVQLPYTRLAAALQDLQGAAVDADGSLAALISSLKALDSLYLGTSQQQQQGAVVAGRACLARLAQQLNRFDTTMFRFNGSLERSAIHAAASTQASLEWMYGVNGSIVNGTGNVSSTAVPTPTAAVWVEVDQLLAPLVAMGVDSIAASCAVVQSALSYPNGSSTLPDISPTLSYLASLRAALAALQQPSGDVASARAAYSTSASDATYATLYNAAGAATGAAATARSAASAPSPSGAASLVGAAANASATASGGSLPGVLRNTTDRVSTLGVWLQAGGAQSASLNRSAAALAATQSVLDLARALVVQSGWSAAASPPPAAANSSAVNGTSTSSPPPPPAAPLTTSAFLQPLQQSIQLIATTLSNGVTAVSEQLDNALGKVLMTPQLSRRRRQLQSSSNTTNATNSISTNAVSNATSIVRQQLVKRMDKIAAALRGDRERSYSAATYWSAVALYSAIITACLLLGVTLYFNFPAGVLAALLLHLVLAVLVLAGAWVVAAGAVVTHDACGNADSLVLGAVSPSSPLFPLVRYYLQGVGGSLDSVLRSTGLGDTARLSAAADTLYNKILNPLLLPAPPDAAAANATAGSPWPGSLGSVQYALGSVLVDLGGVAANVSADLVRLLQLGDRTAVDAQYVAVTTWACCDLGASLLVAWVCATGCGVLAWLAGLSGVMVLKNLDDMPMDSSCGCRCYDPKDYPRPVRRRRGSRSSSSGGGVASSSSGGGAGGTVTYNGGGGGGFGADGAIAKALAMSRTPQLPPQQPVPVPLGIIRTAPQPGVPDALAHVGGGSALPVSKGSPSPRREVVVEAPLFQGRPAAAGWSSPTAASAGGGSDTAAGATWRRPGSSVSVCVMDPETAAALGFTGDGTPRTAAELPPPPPSAPPLPPSPRPPPASQR